MENRQKSLMLESKQEQPSKPPAAKALPSRWIPEHDPMPRVNVNYTKVLICFSISRIASLEI